MSHRTGGSEAGRGQPLPGKGQALPLHFEVKYLSFSLSCFNAAAAQSHCLSQTLAYPNSSEQAPKAFLWMVLMEKSDGGNGKMYQF